MLGERIAIYGLIAVLMGGGWLFIQKLQSDNALLEEKNRASEERHRITKNEMNKVIQTNIDNEAALNRLQDEFDYVTEKLSNLQTKQVTVFIEKEKEQNKLDENEDRIERLSDAKPILMQNRIRKASDELLAEFEEFDEWN